MGNVFPTDVRLHRRYDLKGSTLGRTSARKAGDPNTVLKVPFLSVRLFYHSFIRLFIDFFLPSFIRSFIHSLIHSFSPLIIVSHIHSFVPGVIYAQFRVASSIQPQLHES